MGVNTLVRQAKVLSFPSDFWRGYVRLSFLSLGERLGEGISADTSYLVATLVHREQCFKYGCKP